MQIRIINEVEFGSDNKLIKPDFIYNRFDLFQTKGRTIILKANYKKNDYYIPVFMQNARAVLGVWLMELPIHVLEKSIVFLFRKFNSLKTISYHNAYFGIGNYYSHNHFKIELPRTENELENRISSKSRYNIKREKQLLKTKINSISINEYSAESAVERGMINWYFSNKKRSHQAEYNLSEREYINKFHVSDVYVLETGETIISMILSCEQCDCVYVENMTYDNTFKEFSPGKQLYHEYLLRLIKKGKKEVFLGGGDHQYKMRYGSVEEQVFDSTVDREWYKNRIKIRTKRFMIKYGAMIRCQLKKILTINI